MSWDHRLNGDVVKCSIAGKMADDKDVDAIAQEERQNLIDKIFESAQEILRDSSQNLSVRIIAIEEATVGGAKLKLDKDVARPAEDVFVYQKMSKDGEATWWGTKKIYTHK